MRFADIPGLDEIKGNLIKSVLSNKIPHAQLLQGHEGSGNLVLSLAYASYLNCLNRTENDSCGECAACSKIDKLIHPDLHLVFPVSPNAKFTGKDVISANYLNEWRSFILKNPYQNLNDWNNYYGADNKQGNISKEESRQIIKNLSLMAFEGQFKVMLIWLPEWMHPSAANSILKILEEPPDRTLFLMVSHQADNLLPTILSRVQTIHIRPFSDQEVEQYLVKQIQVDETRVGQIIQLAQGNMREAIKLIGSLENDNQDMFQDWMRICYTLDLTKMVGWSDQYQKMGKVAQKSFLQYAMNMMRETLIAKVGAHEIARIQESEAEFLTKFESVMDPNKVDKLTAALNQAIYHLERNANPKIVFLDLSLVIAKTLKA